MQERLRILELIAEGKITPEQGELLLGALESKSDKRADGKAAWDKASAELKSIGAQVSSALAQGMMELRRGIELNVTQMPFGDFVATSHETEFPADVQSLRIESTNGRVRIERWTQPYIRIYVQADIRVEEQSVAKELLAEAIHTHVSGTEAAMTLLPRIEGARLGGVRIDVYVPIGLETVSVKTRNGAIFADHIETGRLDLDTINGQIRAEHLRTKTLRAVTQNGGVQMLDVVGAMTTNIEAMSRNGAIVLRGIPDTTTVRGRAKTVNGTVQIVPSSFVTMYENEPRRNECTFERTETASSDEERLLSVYLETKNGKISVQ